MTMKQSVWASMILLLIYACYCYSRHKDILKHHYQQKFLCTQELSLKAASAEFLMHLKEKYPVLQDKKYYYLNICNPDSAACIRTMSYLDSLAANASNDIAFVMVTEEKEEEVSAAFQQAAIRLQHSYCLNNEPNLLLGLTAEEKRNDHPTAMQAIIDRSGQLLYYHIGHIPKVHDLDHELILRAMGLLEKKR